MRTAANPRHQDAIDAAVERATTDPDWFCADVLNCPNDPWQSEMMNAVADLDRIRLGFPTLFNHKGLNRFTVRAFHGPGKTHWVAKLMHWFNFTRRGRIPVTAPKEKQVTQRVWPEFRMLRKGAVPGYAELMKVDATKITWINDPDWTAVAEASGSPDNIAGHHEEGGLMFIVEEASGVDQNLFPAIEGALANDGAILILIGNPVRTIGEFYDSHNRKGTMELYYKKAIKHSETPRISKKWVKGMITKYGKDSPAVQSRVFGNFCDTEKNQLIAMEWINDALGKEFDGDGSIPSFRVSIDVADGGLDSSVISIGIHYESMMVLRKQHLYNFKPSIATVKLAAAALLIYRGLEEEFPDSEGDVVVDTAGVGTGTAGILLDEGLPVVLYKGGAGSDDPKQWANRRTQSYIGYRNGLRDGHVVIAEDYCEPEDWDDFFAQHASIKTKEGDKVETLMTKKEMGAAGIKSPDMPDSIKQQYATMVPVLAAGPSAIIETFESMAAADAC